MRFQTTLEGAECLRRSDAGWQSVPGTRRSDEEPAVTNRRTTRRWCDKGRRRRRSQPPSCIHVTFAHLIGESLLFRRVVSFLLLRFVNTLTYWKLLVSFLLINIYDSAMENTCKARGAN